MSFIKIRQNNGVMLLTRRDTNVLVEIRQQWAELWLFKHDRPQIKDDRQTDERGGVSFKFPWSLQLRSQSKNSSYLTFLLVLLLEIMLRPLKSTYLLSMGKAGHSAAQTTVLLNPDLILKLLYHASRTKLTFSTYL